VAAKVAKELDQSNGNIDKKKGRHTTHKGESLKKWEREVMHGQYIRSMGRQLISRGEP